MTGRRLDVWCFDRVAGSLTDADDGLEFAYTEPWLEANMPPLSQSLPLSGGFGTEAVRAFFGGLLPEGPPRDLLARRLGVSRDNDFGLLEALGGDTAGAVSLLPPGERLSEDGDVQWLDDRELAQLIEELPARPMHADEAGEFRLSLAGAQDKLPVVVADGRVGLTTGRTPSTHILKTPIARLDDTVANEAMCLRMGRHLGIDCVHAEPRRAEDRECLLVSRYDRDTSHGSPARRLHQEDFCQALGIPTERKYESEGGPTLADCFALVRRASSIPARDAIRLLDYVALSFLVGNHDAHGKNYSLLYLPHFPRAELAPAYDVLSTAAYRKVMPLSRRMAMKIGGESRPEYVRARHLDELFAAAQLGAAAARRRLRSLATNAHDAARASRTELIEAGWQAPVLDRIVDVVDMRAKRLGELSGPVARRSVG